jgi:hypothetical protein
MGVSERVGCILTRKHYTRLERPAREKHSSLFCPIRKVQGEKSFVNMTPGNS